ncbi:hypothetical protein ES703_40501 [subsurface metagenome]
MPYKANRGGHAPGHLRDAFLQYLDQGSDSDTVTVGESERVVSLRWLIGQLWNCTDILPHEYCAMLELRQGSTYAKAVRKIAMEA